MKAVVLRNFEATFIPRLLYFSVALAWNAFKSVRRVWRRLLPIVTLQTDLQVKTTWNNSFQSVLRL